MASKPVRTIKDQYSSEEGQTVYRMTFCEKIWHNWEQSQKQGRRLSNRWERAEDLRLRSWPQAYRADGPDVPGTILVAHCDIEGKPTEGAEVRQVSTHQPLFYDSNEWDMLGPVVGFLRKGKARRWYVSSLLSERRRVRDQLAYRVLGHFCQEHKLWPGVLDQCDLQNSIQGGRWNEWGADLGPLVHFVARAAAAWAGQSLSSPNTGNTIIPEVAAELRHAEHVISLTEEDNGRTHGLGGYQTRGFQHFCDVQHPTVPTFPAKAPEPALEQLAQSEERGSMAAAVDYMLESLAKG